MYYNFNVSAVVILYKCSINVKILVVQKVMHFSFVLVIAESSILFGPNIQGRKTKALS
jgi:hypothetical protein